MQKKYYPYLDLLKFICCIGIVGIHTWPLFYAVEPLKDWYEKLYYYGFIKSNSKDGD